MANNNFSADTDNMRALSGKLRNSNDQYNDAVKRLETAIEQLQTSWKGTASKDFVGNIRSKKEDITLLGKEVEKYTHIISQEARKIDNKIEDIINRSSNM